MKQAVNEIADSLLVLKNHISSSTQTVCRQRLRFADAPLDGFTTRDRRQARVDGHADVLVDELHGTVAHQEQAARRMVAVVVRDRRP
jgi:hypothetical protein